MRWIMNAKQDEMRMQVALVVELAASLESSPRIANISGYVEDAHVIAHLRDDLRLVGADVVQSTGERALRLTVEELVVAVVHGRIKLVMQDAEHQLIDTNTINEALGCLVEKSALASDIFDFSTLTRTRIRVFMDLWLRGHFVAFGSKFGVDFLVYDGKGYNARAPPSTCHSFAMVLVKEYAVSFATVDIVSHGRMAKMVKKQLVMASEHNDQIVFMMLNHAVLATTRR